MLNLKVLPAPALTVVITLGLYLLITSAFYPLGFLSVFDAKRLLQLGMFVALLAFVIFHAPLRNTTIEQLGRVSKPVGLAIIALFIIGTASSLRLAHPAYALVDVAMIFVMILLVFVTAGSRELSSTLFDKWAVVLLAAMGFAVSVQEFMGFIVGWVIGIEFSYEQVLVHFANPRFYNQLQTWSIPVMTALPLLFRDTRRIKLLCVTLLGLQWFLVFSTGARGTTLSLVTAMVFIAFWLPRQRRYWLRLQLAGVLAGIVFYLGIVLLNNMLIPGPGNFYIHSVGRPMVHTSGRSMLWRLASQDAIANPVLGTGPTRFACDSDLVLPAHPHSFPVRIMGEWGFVALLVLLLLAMSTGFRFLANIKRHSTGQSINSRAHKPPDKLSCGHAESHLRAMLAISVIAGAIHACLSGLLIMPASQVAMLLMAGWALSLSANSQQAAAGAIRYTKVATPLLLAGLLLACAQLGFAAREIPRLQARTGYSQESVQLVPRFWWVGRVCEYRYLKTEK